MVNNNQEYELVIHQNALSCIENVLIRRYQMYRDVYLSPISVLGDELFKLILKRYRENPALHSLSLSKTFHLLAMGGEISLADFLEMKDEDLKNDYEILKHNTVDPVLAYLCDVSHISDYVLLHNHRTKEQIQKELEAILGKSPFSDYSILQILTKSMLYKKEQRLNIQSGKRIRDITECTNLIQPNEVLENVYTFVNPVIYSLDRRRNEQIKESEKEKMKEYVDKNPEEFELKYIVDNKTTQELMGTLLPLFQSHGYQIVSTSKKKNCDDYFDTANYDLFQGNSSLRIHHI